MFEQRNLPLTRSKSTRRGAAAVEFAVTFAVLILLLFAGFEFYRASMLRHGASHAAYLAARTAILPGANVSNVNAIAQTHLAAAGIRSAVVAVSPNPILEDTPLVDVTVTVPMADNSWLVPRFMSPSLVGRARLMTERSGETTNP
jgi:Flp pilus assembly protein TadG